MSAGLALAFMALWTGQPSVASVPTSTAGPIATVAAGIGFSQRTFTITGRDGQTRLRHEVGAFASPTVRFQIRPMVRAKMAFLRPFELDVAARFALPFSSEIAGDSDMRSTRASEVTARAGYRIAIPTTTWSVRPRVGYHFFGFTVRRPRFGDSDSDPPAVAYHSLLTELGVEAPVGLDEGALRATVDVSAAFLLGVSGGQVFSESYFPGGDAKAVRIDAGVRLEILERFFLWVEGQFLAYALSFDSTDDADSGSDRSTALTAGLRADF